MPIPEPAWLARIRAREVKTRNDRMVIRYYGNLYRAQPAWLSVEQKREINRIYRRAKKKKLTVDHIVPLCNPLVCGLHVPWNLRLMTKEENNSRGNKEWPDSPFEQTTLQFEVQLSLI